MQDAPKHPAKEPEAGTLPGLSPEERGLLADPEREFGRYVLLSELGHGGMGVVYRAWDSRLRRVVALKMAAQHGEGGTTRTAHGLVGAAQRIRQVDPDLIDRLQREAQVASRLTHPNLVRVLDAGICDGIFFFTMDLLSGTTAADLPLPLREQEAARIIATLSRAVAQAHQAGILHRDIKPANILLTPRGEPVLIDFGLAKDLAGPSFTATGDVFGTPWYMAPEQAKGLPSQVSARTDIYGLGATLYHLAAGRPPYGELDAPQVLVAVASHAPYPPSTVNPLISAEADRVILKAMAREPRHRYTTADDLAKDLERLASSQRRARAAPHATVVVGTRADADPPAHRRMGMKESWIVAAVLCVVAGAGLATLRSNREPAATSRAGALPESPTERPTEIAEQRTPLVAPGRAEPIERQLAPPSTPEARVEPAPPSPAPPVVTPPSPPPPPPARAAVAPPAGPNVAPATPDRPPEFGWPAEAEESQKRAIEAFKEGLSKSSLEGAEERRTMLNAALSHAEETSRRAPPWLAPRRLRADALFALCRYGDASVAYAEYAAQAKSTVLPAEALVVEFLEWFRLSRPWAEELGPSAARRGSELADRLDAAAADGTLDVSPFLPWRPSEDAGQTSMEAVRADLSTLASLARQDYAHAAEQGRNAAKVGGGVAVSLAELLHWEMVDWSSRPDPTLLSMRESHVWTPETWLVASYCLSAAGDMPPAEEAAVRAMSARDGEPPPEVRSALGFVAYHKGDLDRAKTEWGKAQAAVPTNRVYVADLGAICLLRGEMAEAVRLFMASLQPKTNPEPATDRIVSFAEYEIACADSRTIGEADPHPKAAERARLANEAVACMAECCRVAAKMPRDTETGSTQAPRTYGEWSTNNVRHWATVDPWFEGLKQQPTQYRAMRDGLR